MFSIRTTYPDSICYRPDGAASDSIAPPFLLGSPDSMAARVLLGNPDGVDPNSLARFVSSGIGVPTPCTRRRSPLRIIAQSTRGRILCADILHSNISQPDGRGGHFNFFGYTYPDLLKAFTRRVFLSVYSAALRNPIIGGLQGEFWDLDNKNLKKNISKCRSQISGSTKDHFVGENEVCEISQTHKKGCKITSQQKADFAALRSWLSACGIRLPTAVTPSFQLRIVHRLKHWIYDFLRFGTTYSMHKLDFRKCSKSG
uniref:Uncharacterized protein n=1 Tax=Vitis vinifera TaxID=29760 RepID=A5BPP7_VITVI|nr:hypothetical protein VITISV_029903 [Vitis vinifera]